MGRSGAVICSFDFWLGLFHFRRRLLHSVLLLLLASESLGGKVFFSFVRPTIICLMHASTDAHIARAPIIFSPSCPRLNYRSFSLLPLIIFLTQTGEPTRSQISCSPPFTFPSLSVRFSLEIKTNGTLAVPSCLRGPITLLLPLRCGPLILESFPFAGLCSREKLFAVTSCSVRFNTSISRGLCFL